MTAAVLWLGLLLGLRHALDADHVATVASLAASSGRARDILRIASAWGLGHATVLVAAGMVSYAVRGALPPRVDRALDILVAATLMVLGFSVLVRAARRTKPNVSRRYRRRALLLGGVHGLQGSAALVLMALPAVGSAARAAAVLA